MLEVSTADFDRRLEIPSIEREKFLGKRKLIDAVPVIVPPKTAVYFASSGCLQSSIPSKPRGGPCTASLCCMLVQSH